MITAHVPPFQTLHTEPTHPCAGCSNLHAVGVHGGDKTHYCQLHMNPFSRCSFYAKPAQHAPLNRLAGALSCK